LLEKNTERTIYHAVLQFTQQHPRPHTKGRKPLYPEALILTLALLRTARRASYRHLLFCLAPEALPDQPVPALGTLLYRLKTISDERWHALLRDQVVSAGGAFVRVAVLAGSR
jgi:hypothetical protein